MVPVTRGVTQERGDTEEGVLQTPEGVGDRNQETNHKIISKCQHKLRKSEGNHRTISFTTG